MNAAPCTHSASRRMDLVWHATLFYLQVFCNYECRSLSFGQPHPGAIVEAATLSAAPLPPATYPLRDALPESLVDSGMLSSLQLEGILYACQRHQFLLPSGLRAGHPTVHS